VQEGKISKAEFLQMTARALRNVKLAAHCFEDFGFEPMMAENNLIDSAVKM
jgi:hypothetical protein